MLTWKSKRKEMKITVIIPTNMQVYVNIQIFHAHYRTKAQIHISGILDKIKNVLQGTH